MNGAGIGRIKQSRACKRALFEKYVSLFDSKRGTVLISGEYNAGDRSSRAGGIGMTLDIDRQVLTPPRDRSSTIRDVAHAAGVSVGTASKALNGHGKLRAETIERVKRVAAQLEYHPNSLMQSIL